MSSQLFNLSANFAGHAVAGIAIALIAIIVLSRSSSKLDAIPTVGSSSWLGSWWAGLRYLTTAPEIVREGYEKHKSAPFKVARLGQWIVILSSPKHVDELQRAPSDALSLMDAIGDVVQLDYTMGPEIRENPYHIPILRTRLTRNLGALYPKIRNEVITAFDEVLDLKGNDWKSVVGLSTTQHIICRTSNRVLVGLPLCRNPDWIDLNIRFTLDLFGGAFIIGLFPKFLRPLATRLATNIHRSKERGRKLLGPVIERRRGLDELADKWVNKPDDFLTWLMEEGKGPESTVEFLTTRMLVLNFAGLHSSSASFTYVLFCLATNPQYIQPLREEVEGIVEKDGWSKASLSKMHKVDSFLRECLRVEGMSSMVVARRAVKDFTFSDGTFIPKGTMIGIASRCLHLDDKYYEDANVFKPFRFAEMQEDGAEANKHQFVSVSPEYLTFGLGRHACPGRFFVAIMMKTMLAHIVTTYDVKLEDGAAPPRNLCFDVLIMPNPRAKVQFRKRVD